MTQLEREELVEHYLGGRMTQAEESNFFLHVAVDDELQRTLKAFQIMDRSIRTDREMAVGERSPYREHIMGMLLATPAVISGGTLTGGSSSASAGSGAASTAAGAAGTGSVAGAASLGIWKLVLSAIVGGSLVFGAGIVINKSNSSDDAATRRAADERNAPAQTTTSLSQAPVIEPSVLASSAAAAAEPAGDHGPAIERAAIAQRARRADARETTSATEATRRHGNPTIILPDVNKTRPGTISVEPNGKR